MSGYCQVASQSSFGLVVCGADNPLFGWVHLFVDGRPDRIMVCEFHYRVAQEMGLKAVEIGAVRE